MLSRMLPQYTGEELKRIEQLTRFKMLRKDDRSSYSKSNLPLMDAMAWKIEQLEKEANIYRKLLDLLIAHFDETEVKTEEEYKKMFLEHISREIQNGY